MGQEKEQFNNSRQILRLIKGVDYFMISFTDKRLYVKGTCQAIASDPVTGQILYFSNKFQTGNFQTSVTLGEIRAGLGNPIAAIIPSDAAINVEFTAADFNLWAKAAQVGASLNYNAISPKCQTITAEGTSLTIDVTEGAPVAQYGYNEPFCYVQTIGEASPIATGGTPYPISAEGAISDFVSVSGTQYKVWYFVNKASAQVARLSSMFDPRIVHFTAQIAVYANDVSAAQNEGTRAGWLYAIVPYLKLGGTATITGDQSTPDTTSMSGQAIAFDNTVVSETCESCGGGSTLAYYIYVPDSTSDNISGLAVVGGLVSVAANGSIQIPVKYVMADESLVQPTYSALKFTASGEPSGTTVSETGVVNAGATAGDFEVTIEYPATGTAEYSCVCNVSVTE